MAETCKELLAEADQGKHFCVDCAFMGTQEPIGGEAADVVNCWGHFVYVCAKRHRSTDPVTKTRTFARCRTVRTGDTCPDFQAKPEPQPAPEAKVVVEAPRKGLLRRFWEEFRLVTKVCFKCAVRIDLG